VDRIQIETLADHTRRPGQNLLDRAAQLRCREVSHGLGIPVASLADAGIGIAAVDDDGTGQATFDHIHRPLQRMTLDDISGENTRRHCRNFTDHQGQVEPVVFF